MIADEFTIFCQLVGLSTPRATPDCMQKFTYKRGDKEALVSCDSLVVQTRDGSSCKFSMEAFEIPIDIQMALQLFELKECSQECDVQQQSEETVPKKRKDGLPKKNKI